MDLNINNEQMVTLVTKAIFDSMTPESREELLKGAISSLMVTRKQGHYGATDKTPLQEAFELAAFRVAQTIIEEEMKGDENFRVSVKAAYTLAVEKTFKGDGLEKVVTRVSNAMIQALSEER